MLKYYLEIRLLPTEEISYSFLLTNVFTKIHHALADCSHNGKCPIGVSFPKMDEKEARVGDVIRLFAESQSTLENLNLDTAFHRYKEYLRMKPIREIRNVKGYETYSKAHFKDSTSIIRRYARRKNISIEESRNLHKLPKHHAKFPYIRLHSVSTNQDYMLLIHRTTYEDPTNGDFSSFGLSRSVTVPVLPVYG